MLRVSVTVPSVAVSRFMTISTAYRCLHFPPVSSWSGQEQYGVSGSGQTVYLPLPLCDGTNQTLPFWISFAVAAITRPRSSRAFMVISPLRTVAPFTRLLYGQKLSQTRVGPCFFGISSVHFR